MHSTCVRIVRFIMIEIKTLADDFQLMTFDILKPNSTQLIASWKKGPMPYENNEGPTTYTSIQSDQGLWNPIADSLDPVKYIGEQKML